MRNKFAGTCFRCGVSVPAQAGHFEKVTKAHNEYGITGKWVVRCLGCVNRGLKPLLKECHV